MPYIKSKPTLSKKFSLLTIGVISAIVLVFCIIAIYYSTNKINEQLRQRVNSISNIATAGLKSALWSLEKNTIDDIIRSLFQEEEVVYLRVVDSTGAQYEQIAGKYKKNTFEFFTKSSQFKTEIAAIKYEGTEIGKVYVAISNEKYRHELTTNIASIVVLTLIILLIIPLTSIIITKKYIFKPLKRLEDSATQIAEGNLATPIDTSSLDEIGNLAGVFDEMRKSLEQSFKEMENANKAKDQFLAKVSHEIRNPMNSISGFIELIQGSNLNQDQQQYLRIINSSAHDLLRIINDILDFSRMVSGKLEIGNYGFRLSDILEDIESSFKPQACTKNIKFTIDIEKGTPVSLLGDGGRLKQVLKNLVDNALKYTQHGEVTLGVSFLKQNDDRVKIHFSVKDTGQGIPLQDQERIFNPYEQLKRDSTKGIGLGLTISRQLVSLMGGGEIEVKSEVGKGSTFSFSIPFTIQPDGADSMVTLKNKSMNIAAFEDLEILVVEDEETNRLLVEAYLSNAGIKKVDFACNGNEAIQKISSHHYDIVLMDMLMPELNGYDAMKIIRENPQFKNLPIIALTAFAVVGDEKKCLDAGASDYISKPISSENLLITINKYIQPAKIIPFEEKEKQNPQMLLSLSDESSDKPMEVLNIDCALKRNGQDTYIKCLNAFMKKNENIMDEIKSAFAHKNKEKILFLIHTLIGAAANLEANKLQDAAKKLNQAVHEGKNNLDQSVIDLDIAFKETLEMIRNYCESIPTSKYLIPGNEKTKDKSDLKSAMMKLARLLEELDVDATDIIDKEMTQFTHLIAESEVMNLKDRMITFDFTGALEILKKIANDKGISLEEENK